MSKKSSKLDLLVRVRFENPIPDPPFPPKLLNVSTNVARLGEPSYLDQLASSAPFQLLPDAEMGMPIDLNKFEGVWDGDDSALNPTLDPARVTDAADLELLTPLRIVGAMNGVAGAPAGSSAPKPEVSWMRNTTYMQKKDAAVRRRALAEKRAEEVDASEATQIMAIDKTFIDLTAQPVEEIRHPDAKRKHLRVVETYDILPDDDAWSNSYIMIKFPERPSAATAANPGAIASRGRLDRAVLRPVMEDDQQVMEYFLPKEDDLDRLGEIEQVPLGEESMEKLREFQAEGGGREQGENIDEIMPNVVYDRIRTYEVVMQAQPQKEILLTFVEEEKEDEDDMFGGEDPDEPVKKKRKGVYFKDITMRTQLRKTRAKGRGQEAEARSDLWDKVRVAFREPYAEEAEDRDGRGKPVRDPLWTDDALRTLRGEGPTTGEYVGEGGHDEDEDDEDD